ncbi:class I SAM-dependent methyltransferase [Microbacterium hominis]|uniref:Methyltransferase domain-containing protein n=1 Tax=Microbacterium hominis TaxID=162426 RepID=A0A7D4UGB5_9MICO|nr:class I SAM-dependent methyltransferase [Microbacterium hominis]QKJ19409.1 methyltransferase domain-containing protein [Microbacterium hominis]
MHGGSPHVWFAAGGDEPWGSALRTRRTGTLRLRRVSSGEVAQEWEVGALCGPAGTEDLAVLGAVRSPVLDVGCGPGRMVRAAAAGAAAALGIDVSAEAVRLARLAGTPALERSVFDRLPLEGRWGTILLLDGNIGIGGNPTQLLERCAALLDDGGTVVVESASTPDLDETDVFTVIDDTDGESEPFAWARAGWRAVAAHASRAGFFSPVHEVVGERHVVRATFRRR